MRKVSRLMLATIAGLQSGAHSRRKVKYLREKALVSGLYPMFEEGSIVGGAFFGGVRYFESPDLLELYTGSVDFSGGVMTGLRNVLYIATPEVFWGQVQFAGGVLTGTPATNDLLYEAAPERVRSGASFYGGESAVILIRLEEQVPEVVTGSVLFSGGELDVL